MARENNWELDETATGVGAANTLVIDRDAGGSAGRGIRVFSTDAQAAAECLKSAIGPLAGKRIGVVGAGGVGRAVAYGAAKEGATVVIYSRDLERAAKVERELALALPKAKLVAADTDLLPRTCCDALVNCTPVGMTGGPSPDATAIPLDKMAHCDRTMAIMDTVYAPLETPLLKAAKAAGFKTVDGASLFVLQAQAQFALWTGHEAPAGLFDRLVRTELARQTEHP